jgi:predicted RNA-binding Zn ribbon-like protein
MPLPARVPEIETKPAPMPLLVVQAFVNTWEAETGIDQLADAAAARRWMADAGLGEVPVDLDADADADLAVDLDVDRVRAVRESIRGLLVHNGGGPAPDAARLQPLRDLAVGDSGAGPAGNESGAWLVPVVDGDGRVDLRSEGDMTWAARLLLIIRDAQRDGTWQRLKACRNDECVWAFYDRSHAGRGAWCDMAVCGNRIKNRNLRTRRAAGSGPGPVGSR